MCEEEMEDVDEALAQTQAAARLDAEVEEESVTTFLGNPKAILLYDEESGDIYPSTDNIDPVTREFLETERERLKKVAGAVFMVKFDGRGTGFHTEIIGGGEEVVCKGMTASHVVKTATAGKAFYHYKGIVSDCQRRTPSLVRNAAVPQHWPPPLSVQDRAHDYRYFKVSPVSRGQILSKRGFACLHPTRSKIELKPGAKICVVGFPGAASRSVTCGDGFECPAYELTDEVFGGCNRLCFSCGVVKDINPDGTLVLHDASTLRGMSGSPVILLGDPDEFGIVGVHVAGFKEEPMSNKFVSATAAEFIATWNVVHLASPQLAATGVTVQPSPPSSPEKK